MPYALNAGIKIHYEVRGQGLPILLHTGGLGDLSAWEKAGYLEGLKDYKCILIDPRGHGSSDSPENVEAHRMKDYVSDVVAVLDSVGVYRSSFFGYSNGGRIGFSLCADFPGRISALVTLGACIDPGNGSRQLADFIRMKGMSAYFSSIEARERTRFPLWLRENFLNGDPEMLALEIEGFSKWEGVRAIARRIGTPTLLLTGGQEDTGMRCLKISSQITSGAQVVVLRNLGHFGAFLRSDLVLPHVRDFLARVQFGTDRRFS